MRFPPFQKIERSQLILAAFFALVSFFTLIDMIEDFEDGESAAHMSVEGLIFVTGALGFWWVWRQNVALGTKTRILASDLEAASQSAASWRQQANVHLAGLSSAIDRQFSSWSLSPSEREIALLVLKGLALKEIAEARATSERTVRQQAQEVYRKSGLGGRAELSAFFLEDLLLPAPT